MCGLGRCLFLHCSSSPLEKHQIILSLWQVFRLKSSEVQKGTGKQEPPRGRAASGRKEGQQYAASTTIRRAQSPGLERVPFLGAPLRQLPYPGGRLGPACSAGLLCLCSKQTRKYSLFRFSSYMLFLLTMVKPPYLGLVEKSEWSS